jgi:hypothetical protein
MHGTTGLFLAQINIPDARECLVIAAPFLSLVALSWLVKNIDGIIEHLFPDWEWERNLGWLNFSAQRKADAVLRWVGYLIYACLAAALYGMAWAAQGLAAANSGTGAIDMTDVIWRVSVLVGALGFWVAYFGLELIPKLRNQYETEELKRFRAEQAELEKEREPDAVSREKSPLQKPRLDKPVGTTPARMRPRR